MHVLRRCVMQTSVEANEEAAGGVSDMEQLGRRALPVGGLNGPVKYNIVLGVPPSAHTTSFFPQFLVHFPSMSSLVNQSSSRAAAVESCCLPSVPASSFVRQRGEGGGRLDLRLTTEGAASTKRETSSAQPSQPNPQPVQFSWPLKNHRYHGRYQGSPPRTRKRTGHCQLPGPSRAKER